MGLQLVQHWLYQSRKALHKNYDAVRASLAFAALLVLGLEIALLLFKSGYHPVWWALILGYLGFGLPFVALTVYKMFKYPHMGERKRDTALVAALVWLAWPVVAIGVLYRTWVEARAVPYP